MSSIIRNTALVLLLAMQTTILAEDAVRWAPSVDLAKRVAAAQNQLVLIHFYGDNCPPCRRLEANVFSQASFAQELERNYIPVKVNASSEPEVAKEFGVDRWPQDVVITPAGQIVYRMISPQDQNRYTTVLAQVSAKMNPNAGPQSDRMIAQAANTTPVTSPAPPQQPEPSVAASGSRYSNFSGNSTAPPAAAPNGMAPQQPAAAPSNYSRFASHGGNAQPGMPAEPASQSRFAPANPAASAPGPAAAPASSQFASNQQPVAPPAMPPRQSAPAPSAPPAAAPAAQPGQPKFAMDGYCPVTLVEQMKWQKGDPRWGAQHQGQVYLFSSQADQQKFLSNPNKFSPVMSGIDPVAYLGKGQVVPGDRRFGLTYRGTLYLFSSEESLQAFWGDPQRYSSMVQQAMASQNMHR
ncbi:thioredoxin domain-containing protein [Bremerella sp. JC817]|uniref:thioredoxin domain-containing protein n=1 Tax=Bremerella sp. JC817 TaxID=3231756 RepID=UPI003459E120